MEKYAYMMDGKLLHAIFELLTVCEDNKETLPEAVVKAYDGVQQGLQGGLRLIVTDAWDYDA